MGRQSQRLMLPANKLFVEAVQLISSAEEQTGEAAIKDYEQALAHLQKIIADYSESDLAVKLISGETLFTGKSLKEIKERVNELKRAEAEAITKEQIRMAAERIAAAQAKQERLRKAYDLIKNPIEKAIRKAAEKPTGELTKADYEKLTEEEKKKKALRDSVVGEYENKLDGDTRASKWVFHYNGKMELYGKTRFNEAWGKTDEIPWSIVNKEIHLQAATAYFEVYRINKDRSITWVANIHVGKRTDVLKEEQYNWKKIK